MKQIIFPLLIVLVFSIPTFDSAFALCDANVNYDNALKESEFVFTGTVDRLENYDGPQRVTFIIHEVIKGEINTPKYIYHNTGLVFLDNDTIGSSSVSVDYEIGKTFKVYVENGKTNSCTTKEIYQTDYIWQPGPESGKYTSENPVWEDPCEEGYGLSNDTCITLEEMNKDNPICGQNPKHDFGKCNRVYEEPENTLEQVLVHCNATGAITSDERTWWNATHYIDNTDCEFLDKVRGSQTYGLPIPEPYQNYSEPIPPLTKIELVNILCVEGYMQVGSECVSIDELKTHIFFIVLLVVITIVVIYYIRRKRK